jgi:MFS family permease
VSQRGTWLTLVAMTLASSMILVDQTAVLLATPEVVDGLDASLSLSPWVLTANILPLAALMVLGGRLGDLLGLRRVFLAGAAVFATATVLAGLAQDITWLIALLGALACLVLIRRSDRLFEGTVFARRSRWVLASSGRSPGVTRHPPPG